MCWFACDCVCVAVGLCMVVACLFLLVSFMLVVLDKFVVVRVCYAGLLVGGLCWCLVDFRWCFWVGSTGLICLLLVPIVWFVVLIVLVTLMLWFVLFSYFYRWV